MLCLSLLSADLGILFTSLRLCDRDVESKNQPLPLTIMDIIIPLLPVLFLTVALGLYIWSGVWVYRDAERRGKPGALVALLVLLIAWPIGLLVWIALRPERQSGGFDLNDYRVQ